MQDSPQLWGQRWILNRTCVYKHTLRVCLCPTRRAIFILRVQFGPEFFSGKRWLRVMSSASSRRVRGRVSAPNEHSCFSSITWNWQDTFSSQPVKNNLEQLFQKCQDGSVPRPPALGFWGCELKTYESPPKQVHWSYIESGRVKG